MKRQGLGLTPGQGDYNQVTRPSAVSVAHSKVLTQVSSQASCGQKSPISFFFFFGQSSTRRNGIYYWAQKDTVRNTVRLGRSHRRAGGGMVKYCVEGTPA